MATTSTAGTPRGPPPTVYKEEPQSNMVLQTLYGMSSFLAAFQILFTGAKLLHTFRLTTGRVGSRELALTEKGMAEAVGKSMGLSEGGALYFARAFMGKYHGQSFVFVTHMLGAPLWSAIIPFQLHPASRSPSLKKMHRALGSTFFALSASMMVGFLAIMGKGLQIHPGASWSKGLEGKARRDMPALLRAFIPANTPFMFLAAAWFTYTMQRALRAAWRKRFAEHEEWVLRHVASGQWISLMRMFLGATPAFVSQYGDTQDVFSSVFTLASVSGWTCCVLAAELGVALVRGRRARDRKLLVSDVSSALVLNTGSKCDDASPQGHHAFFSIIIDRSDGGSFGVTTEEVDDGLQITAVQPGGHIAKWNAENPDRPILVRDCIVGVNGASGEEMFAETWKNTEQELRIARPSLPRLSASGTT